MKIEMSNVEAEKFIRERIRRIGCTLTTAHLVEGQCSTYSTKLIEIERNVREALEILPVCLSKLLELNKKE